MTAGIVKPEDAKSKGAAAVAEAWQRTIADNKNLPVLNSRALSVLLGMFLVVWLLFS